MAEYTSNGTNGNRILAGNGQPYRGPDDEFALPMRAMFAASTRVTLHDRWDEATRRGREEANSMRRDAFISGLLQERTLGVTSLKFRIEVDNDRDPQQKAIKDGLQSLWNALPYRQKLMYALQDETTWVGRGATQTIWENKNVQLPAVQVKSFGTGMGATGAPPPGAPPMQPPGQPGVPPMPGAPPGAPPQMGAGDQSMNTELRKACVIKCHQPVSGDSLGHLPDGTPYLLVNQTEANNIPGAQTTLTNYGRAILLVGQWRTRFLLDSHIPTAAEFFDWERAEAIHGIGLRTLCYWRNFMRLEHDESVNSWIQRVGLGVRVWKFRNGNAVSKAAVEKAAAEQTDTVNILVPVTDEKGIEGVDFLETGSAGSDLLLRLLEHEEAMLERLIIGAENSMGSGGGQGDSLGGEGKAKNQRSIQDKIILFDAQNRCDALTESWLRPTLRWTWPDFWSLPARLVADTENQDPQKLLTAAKSFCDLGGTVGEAHVRGELGFPEPQPGDKLLQSQQQAPPGAPPGAGGPPGAPGAPPGPEGQPAPPEPNPQEMAGLMQNERKGQPERYEHDGFTEIADALLA